MLNDCFYLIYTSKCSPELSEIELIRILYEASRGNARKGITGVLVHKKGQFMQLLEGDQFSVVELFDRIRKDERHFLIESMIFDEQPCRVSKEFMAYRHKKSKYSDKFKAFFKENYDFNLLKDEPLTVYEFFESIAKPTPVTEQEKTYQDYKKTLMSAVKKSAKSRVS